MMLKLKLQYFGHLMRKLTHWKRLWCWEGLEAGGEGDDRGWDGWMASLIRWTWVWVKSGSWWWTGRPGVLRFMGSQRVGHDWATELNAITSLFQMFSTTQTSSFPVLWLVGTEPHLVSCLSTKRTSQIQSPLGIVGWLIPSFDNKDTVVVGTQWLL